MKAKAMVTMARNGPAMREAGGASSTPTAAETNTASITPEAEVMPPRIATAKALIPNSMPMSECTDSSGASSPYIAPRPSPETRAAMKRVVRISGWRPRHGAGARGSVGDRGQRQDLALDEMGEDVILRGFVAQRPGEGFISWNRRGSWPA